MAIMRKPRRRRSHQVQRSLQGTGGLDSYSPRSVRIGSIEAARRAGHNPANAEQRNKASAAPAIVAPSSGFTP